MEQVSIVLSKEDFKTLLECLKDMRTQVDQIWTELPSRDNTIEAYEQALQKIQGNLRAQVLALSTILVGSDLFSNGEKKI